MQLAIHEFTRENITVRARNAAIRVYIDALWSTQLLNSITTLLVELLPCFLAQSPPASDSKTLPRGRPKSLTPAFNNHLTTLRPGPYAGGVRGDSDEPPFLKGMSPYIK